MNCVLLRGWVGCPGLPVRSGAPATEASRLGALSASGPTAATTQRVSRGHCAGQNCYAKMLAKVPRGSLKPLPCPVCRVVAKVERGRADSLLKNFPLLR